jgi:hypothetical protein
VAKRGALRLKVFQAQIGFYDTVVAAPSQAAALRAWGVHQDLFANGGAKAITDELALAAALAHPEKPLRRVVGSKGRFKLEPNSPPNAAGGPKRAAARTAKAPADRTALDAAETALRQLGGDRKREEADFRRRQETLDAEKDQARRTYAEVHRTAIAAVVRARQVYRKAGGKN